MIVTDGLEGVTKGVIGATTVFGDALENIKGIGTRNNYNLSESSPRLVPSEDERSDGDSSYDDSDFTVPKFGTAVLPTVEAARGNFAEAVAPVDTEIADATTEMVDKYGAGEVTTYLTEKVGNLLNGEASVQEVLSAPIESPELRTALTAAANDPEITNAVFDNLSLSANLLEWSLTDLKVNSSDRSELSLV